MPYFILNLVKYVELLVTPHFFSTVSVQCFFSFWALSLYVLWNKQGEETGEEDLSYR